MVIGVSLVFGILGVIYVEEIFCMMGGSEMFIVLGKNYIKILFGSNMVIMLLFLLNGIFWGVGDVVYVMWVFWLVNGINIIFDLFFIYGFGLILEMGVVGVVVVIIIGWGIGVVF